MSGNQIEFYDSENPVDHYALLTNDVEKVNAALAVVAAMTVMPVASSSSGPIASSFLNSSTSYSNSIDDAADNIQPHTSSRPVLFSAAASEASSSSSSLSSIQSAQTLQSTQGSSFSKRAVP